ncbi:hypothetical protein [Sporohalobacter salinus]|uniref:hypothetical protein n=1 Tax=Sporohalobacter salinus TaxID=1494606 RepID=UPI001961DAB3|nr:hypothetical protein [Sporohalobacter salinus]MBM7623056.1 hypothetical protein [Sporohalobacter salinus]
MDELPDFYQTGSTYKDFRRNSGWWVNIYVYRSSKLKALYKETDAIQEKVAEIYEDDLKTAINMIDEFAYNAAVSWHEQWKKIGDHLFGKYAMGYINFHTIGYPEWWNGFIGYDKIER